MWNRGRLGTLALLLVIASPLIAAETLSLKLPSPPVRANIAALKDPAVQELRRKVAAGVLDAHVTLARQYEQRGFHEEAAGVLRKLAGLLRQKRLEDAAVIQELRAEALTSDLQLFGDVRVSARAAGGLYTGAPAEPVLGCYSGAFIDMDDSLGKPIRDENWQMHRMPEQFFAKMGRSLGSMFIYLKYSPGNNLRFPRSWVNKLKAAGVVPHIALEPERLEDVQDDEYLQNLVLEMREADCPLFIRFASEMNGKWTPYHGKPALYKEKFQLVSRVVHRLAPRAAMVWCVSNPPLGNAFDYYPGDDAVDWVGVNFYAVPFLENDPKRPATNLNPLALLDPVYKKFAAKKPIAICEFAASHRDKNSPQVLAGFAEEKLNLVYGALPLLYPRVKMISWFNMSTIKNPRPGKSRNDFLLTEHPQIRAAWLRETAPAHFLHTVETLGSPLPPVAKPLKGLKLSRNSHIRIWARAHCSKPRVYVELDGKIVRAEAKSGAHVIPTEGLKVGRHSLTAYLYDDKQRFVRQVAAEFVVVATASS